MNFCGVGRVGRASSPDIDNSCFELPIILGEKERTLLNVDTNDASLKTVDGGSLVGKGYGPVGL
jgi:hypothetical protein